MAPTPAVNSSEADKYVAPHERKSGPWAEYDLEDAGRTMEMADKIRGNPKFVEAVAKHHEKKAKHHRKMADGMRSAMQRGLVSEKAMTTSLEKTGKQQA